MKTIELNDGDACIVFRAEEFDESGEGAIEVKYERDNGDGIYVDEMNMAEKTCLVTAEMLKEFGEEEAVLSIAGYEEIVEKFS